MSKKTVKSNKPNISKISSSQRLEELLHETEKELEAIQPQIEKLERQLDKLKELKLAKQKLITLKLSIKSILSNFSNAEVEYNTTSIACMSASSSTEGFTKAKNINTKYGVPKTSQAVTSTSAHPGVFIPERAFQEADRLLRKKTSINYELYRAIVLNGGHANTDEIKRFLVDNKIRQPGSGEPFDNVELTDISSRINYLVRKGLVGAVGRGVFTCKPGWESQEAVI